MSAAAPAPDEPAGGVAPRHPLDADGFRATLGSWPSGVSVLTSVADGEPHAMTASAVASLSLDPMQVLVCVDRGAAMAEVIAAAEVFALSFLAEDQAALSEAFADPLRPRGAAQFAGVRTATVATGAPVLVGAVGFVDCQVARVLDGGDHLIVVGDVVALGTDAAAEPLVYLRGRYGRFEAIPDA